MTGYTLEWLAVGKSKIPIALVDGEPRIPIRLFAASMGLTTDKQRSFIRRYSDAWEIRGVKVSGSAGAEPTLSVRWFDVYLWRVNYPLNTAARARLDQVRREWRQAFMAQFEPEAPGSPSQQRAAAAVARAKDHEIAELRAEVQRLHAEMGKRRDFRADASHRASKGGTRPLGAEDFAAIRDPDSAAISNAEMAQRHLASTEVIRKIRQGTYLSRPFTDWLAAQGLERSTAHDENLQTAKEAWSPEVPDWVLALAHTCDGASQGMVARRLSISTAAVNLVLHRKYRGRYDRLEQRIREELMGDGF